MTPARLAALCLAAGCASEPIAPVGDSLRGAFPPVPVPADNPMSAAKVELGRLLFHDPILSTDRQVACVTCHGQIWGLSDGLRVSVGVGGVGPAGTGRRGPNVTRRNASTLWNVAWRPALFWDGRAASLEEQALGPMRDPRELGRPPEDVAADLARIPAYGRLFADAFPGEAPAVSARNLVRALAAFQRTLVSTWAPYDRYTAGDRGALGTQAVRGLNLFQTLGCVACHAPPTFDRMVYEPSFSPGTPGAPSDDGRAEVTGRAEDRGRFLVPTLRNVGETGPYFHDGAVGSLADAVSLEATHRPGSRALTPAERDDLVAFLREGMTDLHRLPERPDAVPSGLMVPLDGYRIPR
ncbi:MAG: cytochrome c peroxidase [Polyangiales bacterium]